MKDIEGRMMRVRDLGNTRSHKPDRVLSGVTGRVHQAGEVKDGAAWRRDKWKSRQVTLDEL